MAVTGGDECRRLQVADEAVIGDEWVFSTSV
jgi:hypothetical protein